jgi:predicted 3-demethylubiquinone-9 3-methyltransferase (glyoxalase superfamily)
MQKIYPMLWFENQAEEAANFYASLFPNSKVTDVSRYGPEGPGPEGSAMVVAFELDGQQFTALNGGPMFKFTEAVSFVVPCDTQAEIDRLWGALSAGGEEQQCGWLKDRFGLSWQIVPAQLGELMGSPDPEANRRVTQALFRMVKLDLAELQKAHAGA